MIAESRTAELLCCIQPNGHSEVLRQSVSDYVSGLVQKSLDCKVYPFGSVPLRTYLPDGDIDLTAFSNHQELRDSWNLDVQSILEQEVQRKDAEFTVSNVQCIYAEVKIVKCVVEGIVVDISFNQLGGVCALCFLEEVDRLIQKDHLFKRSIILVKAWCFYESRVLGAHHALLSTYALEILVLYIFNVFHSTLRGPLEVLLTFLDYFSKFDWEHYCVSLWGPVPLSSLPDLTAETPFKDGKPMLLSKAFLEKCSALYDVFPKGSDTQTRSFSCKFLNIIDPLRNNNNLGRSVSQANFYRIKSAFQLGARQLAKVFDVADEDFPKCLDDFFANTWERHQNGHRPDAANSSFPPYVKFVYNTRKCDILGGKGVEYPLKLPEVENFSFSPAERITSKGEEASSHISYAGSRVKDSSTVGSEYASDGEVIQQLLEEPSKVKSQEYYNNPSVTWDNDRNTKVGSVGGVSGVLVSGDSAESQDEVFHEQNNCNYITGTVPFFHICKTDGRLFSSHASVSDTSPAPSIVRDVVISDDTDTKTTADFLTPEPDSILYASSIPVLSVVSSSSSMLVLPFIPDSSAFTEPDGDIDANAKGFLHASAELKSIDDVQSSEGLASSDDAQLFSSSGLDPDGLCSRAAPSKHQKIRGYKKLQCSDQSDQALQIANSGPFHSNTGQATGSDVQFIDINGTKRDDKLNGNIIMHTEVQQCSKTTETDQTMQSSRWELYDANRRTRKKGNRYKGSEVLQRTANLRKPGIYVPSQGMGTAGSVTQQLYSLLDAPQPGLFGTPMIKASPIQEGGNYITHPMMHVHNPFGSPFPLSSYGPQVQNELKLFMDGLSRENTPYMHNNFQQTSESTSAALSERFASLSAEESLLEQQQDFLKSDLANHLRNLEFGRLCQDPVLQAFAQPPYMQYGGQNSCMWNIPAYMAPHSPDQLNYSLKAAISGMLSPHDIGSIPIVFPGPHISEIRQLHRHEPDIDTAIPVRDGMYADLKSLGPQEALYDQGSKQKHPLTSTGYSPVAPAFVPLPLLHDPYHVPAANPVFLSEQNATSSLSGHSRETALQFGSLGPIEISGLPCSNLDNKLYWSLTGSTNSNPFSSSLKASSSRRAYPNGKVTEES
ncbi:hypothetical protein KP509_1Z071100 [Ceratopteris richardii]|nr:hypothetical protein KP509_1Z071100 [Ceratopteris richardii]